MNQSVITVETSFRKQAWVMEYRKGPTAIPGLDTDLPIRWPNWPMGYLQLGTITKKRKIPCLAIPPHLALLKTDATRGLLIDSLSSALLPTAPFLCIQYSINFYLFCSTPGEFFHLHAIGFYYIVTPHLRAPSDEETQHWDPIFTQQKLEYFH